MRVRFNVNGEDVSADNVWPGESLLYVLRERLGLPGSKNACEQGECGSCTVYFEGRTACSCMIAAGQAEGCTVRTVEGLSRGRGEEAGERALGVVQEAFVEAGAVQCGFCTPGLLVQTDDLLERTVGEQGRAPDDAQIREALAGNLCRCTGYEKIIDAVHLAAERRARADSGPRAGGGQ